MHVASCNRPSGHQSHSIGHDDHLGQPLQRTTNRGQIVTYSWSVGVAWTSRVRRQQCMHRAILSARQDWTSNAKCSMCADDHDQGDKPESQHTVACRHAMCSNCAGQAHCIMSMLVMLHARSQTASFRGSVTSHHHARIAMHACTQLLEIRVSSIPVTSAIKL